MWDDSLRDKAAATLAACRAAGLRLTAAESCTGGLIAAVLTAIPGSSDVFERGFVTYSNEAKTEMLGVPAPLIDRHGAVSEEVARSMAEGALGRARAEIAVSVTGVAGPAGGTAAKPVGLVHIACAAHRRPILHRRCEFKGDRDAVRLAATHAAFDLIIERATTAS